MSKLDEQIAQIGVLWSQGKAKQAADLVQQLTRMHPKRAEIWLAGFDLMVLMGNRPRAMAYLDGADRCEDLARLGVQTGQLLSEAGWYDAGIQRETERFGRVQTTVEASEIAFDLTVLHTELGEHTEAVDWLLRTNQAKDQSSRLHTKMMLDSLMAALHLDNYVGELQPEDQKSLLERQMAWSAMWREESAKHYPPLAKREGGPLRVVFVSPDLHRHSVAYFLEPLLAELDGSRITPHLVSLGARSDEMTERLTALVEAKGGTFTNSMGQTNPEIVTLVRAKLCADVAIDLAGLTPNNRAEAFAAQLAPVQLTWLGYPGSTGLATVHGRIVDAVTDPMDTPWWCPEARIRLPGPFVCYKPPSDAPAVGVREDVRAMKGPVRFGSFNIARKIGEQCLVAWAEAMKAAGGSTLVIKSANLEDEESRARFTERVVRTLMKHGVADAAGRVTVLSRTKTMAASLALYNTIDIALDTAPYCGTTTTCEALLMGVPVVTLAPADGAHASRVGASLLHAVGHDELVAATAVEFGKIAAELAADRARLAGLHGTLRGELLSSELCNAKLFAERWQGAVIGAAEQMAK